MDQQSSSKKWLWIGLGIFFVLLLLGGLFWFFGKGTKVGETIGNIFPFGAPTQDIGDDGAGGREGEMVGSETSGAGDTITQEPMFRQLTNVPIAGAYALQRDGVDYVRYIEKETGHAYEVSIKDGVARQLTNTTIPRIALADWAGGGSAVVLRYLEKDPLSGRDIIKTHLGRLPAEGLAQAGLTLPSASSSDQVGTLQIELLPNNIIALSVAPDGKDLFYLIKAIGGVSGSIVNLSTKTTKEVFRNTFSEWSPQLLNDDTIILTTKPSWNVQGYSYRYDPKTKVLERLVREKNGLTALGNSSASRVLYGENIVRDASLWVYNKSGFPGDEGLVYYEKMLPLATLPEKCAWLKDGIRTLCGAFVNTPSGTIPDLWYQGRLSFADTFWSIDTDTSEIAFLADPKKEAGQEFDVMNPMISANEDYFIFTNKRDETLWSMHVLPPTPLNDSAEILPEDL